MRVSFGRRIKSGAIIGFEVWLAYALIEYVFGTLGTLLLRSSDMMLAPQWRGTVDLFVIYSLTGILLGVLAALLFPKYDDRGRRKLLVMSVVVLYGANLVYEVNLDTGVLSPISIASLVALVGIAFAVIRDVGGTTERKGPASQPWLVSCALLLSSAVAHEAHFGWRVLIPLALATAALVIGGGVMVRRLADLLASRVNWMPILQRIATAGLILGLIFGPYLLSSPAAVGTLNMRPVAAVRGRPNIVLVTLDTVRADHMGLYGYSRSNTPNLESFAQHATYYSNFVAAASLTLPSHASIFTGLYAQSHGAYMVPPDFMMGRPLPDTIPTVASLLSSAGYRTMAVAANRYYLRPEWGIMRGFQYADMDHPVMLISPRLTYLLRISVRRILAFDGILQDLDAPTIRADEVNRHAYDLLDKADTGSPFFLFLNYTDAHSPYVPPAPYSEMYPGRTPSITAADYEAVETKVD